MSFSGDYAAARLRFRTIVLDRGGRLTSIELKSKGPLGEPLTIDVGWFGAPDAQRLLLHSSGLHGIEGFAGSAIQLQFLRKLPEIPQDGAIVLVHVLNPYGMAWLRRVNENNVDLNRNFVLDGKYEGSTEHYKNLNSFLNPTSPPSNDLFTIRAAWLVLRYGMSSLKLAVAGGQYDFPTGLFFGGTRLEEGPSMYKAFLEEGLRTARTVLAIDVHTGLGPYAVDTLLVEPRDYATIRQAFGDRVTAQQQGPAYTLRGGIHPFIHKVCAHATVACIGQEFGTFSPVKVLHALRQENQWHHYGGRITNHISKTQLMEMFCPSDSAWREAVLNRGDALLRTAFDFVFA